MKNFSKLVFAILIVVIVGSGVFLFTWEIPAPTQIIEREFPDDRFPR